MSFETVEEIARALLKAWSDRKVAAVTALYAEDCVFIDPSEPAGLRGREELTRYCENLFAQHPGNSLQLDKVWQVEGGFCVRWYCDVDDGRRVRGFELVLLDGELIVHEEGYFHLL